MANILVYMAPNRGSIYPLIPTLDALVERNHRVCVVSTASELDRLCRRGIEAVPMSDEVECAKMDDYERMSFTEAFGRRLECKLERAPLEAEDIRLWTEKLHPDCLVVDGSCIGAPAWAEGSGFPWASWATELMPFPAQGIPAFGLGLPLKQSAFSAIKNGIKNWGKSGSIQKVCDPLLEPINDFRTSHGAMAVSSVFELPSALQNLIYFTAEPIEYSRDWPSNVNLVGPNTWEPFEETVTLKEDKRPILLISAGCDYQDEVRLIRATLRTFDPEQFQIVVTTAAIDPSIFEAPGDAQIVRFSAHNPILDKATCAICPGNFGFTQKCLCHGVPVLAVPFCRDQIEVGQRLKHLKVGVALPSEQLSSQNLASSIEKVLACRPAAQALGQELAQYNSTAQAVGIIEHLFNHE